MATIMCRPAGEAAIAGLLLLGLALAGCARAPNPSLEAASATVAGVAAEPEVQRRATPELARAQQALQRAETAWRRDAAAAEVEHLAYLAEQSALTARAVAAEGQARDEIERLAAERESIQLEARERDLALTERRAEQAESELEALRQQLAELEAIQTARGLELTLGDVLFEFDSDELTPGGMQRLARLAEVLQASPAHSVLIEGHTDSVGDPDYNLGLSERRANAVQDFLIMQGVEPTRIVAHGYGQEFPLAPNDTEAGRQQNRRVEVVILEEGAPHPARRTALLR
jgi:OmpA-OmpF porin, OOP family